MPDMDNPPAGVAETQERAGMALGALVRDVGLSVAATQRRMNETCATTASALAGTMVEIVAVRQTEYADDGEVGASSNILMELPLVNFVDPVNYQFERLHLQGVFHSSEVRSGAASSVDTTHRAGSASVYLGVWGGGASAGDSVARAADAAANGGTGADWSYQGQSTSHAATGTGSAYRQEVGQIRMNAEILPRTDIGVPKPNHVVRGPRLSVVPHAAVELPQDRPAGTPLAARAMRLTVDYRRRPAAGATEGTPIQGASFTIETDGLPWSYCDAAGNVDESPTSALHETAADGTLHLLLRRGFTPGEETAPRTFTLTVRIGLIRTSIPVSL